MNEIGERIGRVLDEKKIARALERGLDKAADVALSEAKALANPRWSNSIEVRDSHTGYRKISWSYDRWYLNFVENGRSGFGVGGTERVTRSGRRTGKLRHNRSTAKVLHFQINGQDVFTRHVGPIVAHPFMGPAEELVESRIGQILTDEVNAAVA